VDELSAIAAREASILLGFASNLRSAGRPVLEVSVGATPTARFIGAQKGVTEMRPGNYVFFDRTQVGLTAARLEDCALTVVSTVVSRPTPGRVVFDAGSKTLTSDGLRGFGLPTGHGLVFPGLDDPTPDPSIVIERLSEEHAVARVLPGNRLRPGDRVRILPNHACPVTNLADELLMVEGVEIVDRVKVEARGRCS
jgi:D-serine deaminase-like pyridoxal phosphate-dependent protein